MLYDQKLLKFLWGEATNTTVYVQNRVPHQALDNKTLEEVFTGVKLDIGHLRIFCCPIYFHVSKNKRSKLEATRRKCKFVGYSEDSKAFRIYISDLRKVKISRDVTFDDVFALGKARDLPPPPPPEENSDDMDILEGPFVPKFEKDIVDDPMEPMDPLDPPPSDPPTRKITLWLKETLQDVERHVVAR